MPRIALVPTGLVLTGLALAVISAAPARAQAAKGTPGYICAEDSYAKRYRQERQRIDALTRNGGPGELESSDTTGQMRETLSRFDRLAAGERNKMAAAVRSCRARAYAASKSAVMTALRKADAELKRKRVDGQAAIREKWRRYRKRYRVLGDKWMAVVARCTRLNRHSVRSGSANEWEVYRTRMQTRVTVLNRKASEAVKAAQQHLTTLDRRYRFVIRMMNRQVLSLPSYPRPCSIAMAPALGGWIGKWATNRGNLCIKGGAGGLTVKPVDGGLLQRRRGKVTVGSASPADVSGRWSIPFPEFIGRFRWHMLPGGGHFEGKFSEQPGGPMNRRWYGRRRGPC